MGKLECKDVRKLRVGDKVVLKSVWGREVDYRTMEVTKVNTSSVYIGTLRYDLKTKRVVSTTNVTYELYRDKESYLKEEEKGRRDKAYRERLVRGIDGLIKRGDKMSLEQIERILDRPEY